jgi:hypothetical protein
MAEVCKHDEETREDWIRWAMEFVKRGIEPEDCITVHGPHAPNDYMWGEMGEYEFRTCRGTRGIHDVRGLRIRESVFSETVTCPILPIRELDHKRQRWLQAAERTLARRRQERQALNAQIGLVRRRMQDQKRQR